ncbi:endo alpha-1,4 polygalactosaminidase [candidate division KSB1 bacterium]|nr:endo alpha-1,4 polygalactosaminidase [candidate division KSB1 bacterium]
MKNLTIIIFVSLTILITGCKDNGTDPDSKNDRNYRQDMRDFVQSISAYAKGFNPNFVIIPQNGHNLLTLNGEKDGEFAQQYLTAIDGVGREDLFYGYENDNTPTPQSEQIEMIAFMDIAESNNVQVLATDYCWTESFMLGSYQKNEAKGYISFAADHRDLDNIPSYPQSPYNENSSEITSLVEAKNFLYLINPSEFVTKSEFIDAVKNTNYDLVLIDLFYGDNVGLSSDDVSNLKFKQNGGSRLVLAYMSIGEAEDYRYYWQSGWKTGSPEWLLEENPNWEGNYKVSYWDKNWQNIIYGNDNSYLKKIIDTGFDGVYLDIIDAFEYFESE